MEAGWVFTLNLFLTLKHPYLSLESQCLGVPQDDQGWGFLRQGKWFKGIACFVKNKLGFFTPHLPWFSVTCEVWGSLVKENKGCWKRNQPPRWLSSTATLGKVDPSSLWITFFNNPLANLIIVGTPGLGIFVVFQVTQGFKGCLEVPGFEPPPSRFSAWCCDHLAIVTLNELVAQVLG